MRLPKTVWLTVLVAALAVILPSASRADWQEELRITIPFGFVVDDTRLPAGEYLFSTSSGEPNALRVDRIDGEVGVLTLTQTLAAEEMSRSYAKDGNYLLVFLQLEGHRFLQEIHLRATDMHWRLIDGSELSSLANKGLTGTYYFLPVGSYEALSEMPSMPSKSDEPR